MPERVFEFIDGSSKKFWAIAEDGDSHTVRFGRIGTAGQSKTKTFPTAAAAQKDADKLIAEKTGKGYQEVTAAPAAPAKPKKEKEPELKAAPAPSTKHAGRSIDLDPADYLWVTYKLRPTIPPAPPPKPFDLDACLKELLRATEYIPPGGTKPLSWNYERIRLRPPLAPEEAEFWFAAIRELKPGRAMSIVQKKLERTTFTGAVTNEDLRTTFEQAWPTAPGAIRNAAAEAVLTPETMLKFTPELEHFPQSWPGLWHQENLVHIFQRRTLPLLTDEQRRELQSLLRPQVALTKWPNGPHIPAPLAFHLAALVGLHREMESLVHTWPDGVGVDPNAHMDFYYHPQRTVFGLATAEKVEFHFRRLKLRLFRPEYVRAWIAHTGWSALDVVRDAVLSATRKDEAETLIAEFCRVHAPEAAPYMLELWLDSKAPAAARQWLTDNLTHAVAGLLPVAAGKGKLAQAALEFLRDLKRKGQTDVIEEQLKNATPELKAFLRLSVLERQEKTYPALTDSAMPADLRKTLDAAPAKPNLPPWTDVGALPPILVGGAKLSEDRVAAMLTMLRTAKPEVKPAVAIALKKHADPVALDAFAWHLFELWLREGLPSKEKWAFLALGLFGGDASALKLTPFVREWPGMSKHQQAVTGLQMLREIGTDTALMQLNGVAQKVKFQGVKNKAREMMEAIAADRNMTRTELEDRIVPDLDLDAKGGRTFDFGPRQFRMAIGPDLVPVIRDADGKVRADLPAPGAKDDAEKAPAAVAEWKLLKKQLKELLKLQGPRLEQAMVTMRRWPLADFETLLVKHPLMTNLVRRLVWAAYDSAGKPLTTFRVTEEQEYAGRDDKPVSLVKAKTVGIVHPLHLDEPAKAAWGQLLGEYEVIPPFLQLGRPVFHLDKAEAKEKELKRFAKVGIPSGAVWGTTEKLGWTRGSSSDHGVVQEFVKWFPAADVTAVFTIEPGIVRGALDMIGEDQKITSAFFLTGKYDPIAYPYHKAPQMAAWGTVDAVAVSEVLADLSALAAKGK